MTDSTNPEAKIALRKYYLDQYPEDSPPKILDCFTGEEQTIFRALYSKIPGSVALDLKLIQGAKKIDAKKYIPKHANQFDFFDLDAYGSPFEIIANIAYFRRNNAQSFVICATDGTRLNMNYQHGTRLMRLATNNKKGIAIPRMYKFQDEIIGWILLMIARKWNYQIEDAKMINGDTGNMNYFGFRMTPIPNETIKGSHNI